MDYINLFLIGLIMFFIYKIYINYKKETFIIKSPKDQEKEVKLFEKTNTRKSRIPMADPMFDKVVLYKSSTDVGGKLGTQECLEKCKGQCVDYGLSGNSFCFEN
jgi:hypothetical protein